jgi:hypothetical protein
MLLGFLGVCKKKAKKYYWGEMSRDNGWRTFNESPTWTIFGLYTTRPNVGDVIYGTTDLGRIWLMDVERVTQNGELFMAILSKWRYDPDQYVSSFPGD